MLLFWSCSTDLYTLSLHDALPIFGHSSAERPLAACRRTVGRASRRPDGRGRSHVGSLGVARSEEHTSELQSHSDLVCRLLLEKKTSLGQFSGRVQQTYKHPVQRDF